MSSVGEIIKVACITCGRATNHDIVQQVIERDATPDGEIDWWESFEIVKCRGCDTITFCQRSGTSENFDEEGPIIEQRLYPGRTAGKSPMKDNNRFPPKTRQIYLEVLQALNNDAPILSAIGLRSLIESVCVEQNTSSNNLMGGIDELVTLGLLAQYQADFLHAHRFLGNVAAHEMRAPKPNELNDALDIAETLLKTIYVLPYTVARIRTGKNKSKSS